MTTQRYVMALAGLALAPPAVAMIGNALHMIEALRLAAMVVTVAACAAGAVAAGRRS